MGDSFYSDHEALLETAKAVCDSREYWSAFDERPSTKVYGETAGDAGQAAFESRLHKRFEIDLPASKNWIGAEVSPYTGNLGITYPAPDIDSLILASKSAGRDWARKSVERRLGVCLEALARLNASSFELAHAVQHTTGQSFVMAFQAGGPHAQDRGLEALAYAAIEMGRIPATAHWEKPQGKRPPLEIDKEFRIIPRGIGLVIGCNTFPTWNSYPAIFANLATGNTVIVKPHPKAILPLAITVEILRACLKESGLNPNVVTLAVDIPDAPISEDLVRRDEIRIIDFTGGSAYGTRLETEQSSGTLVYTEKSGVNNVLVDSTDNFAGMLFNLALSLSLYSGQMCTTPQNIFVPAEGIETNEGHKDFDEVVTGLKGALDGLLGDDAKAASILGAIVNEQVDQRLTEANASDKCVLLARSIDDPSNAGANIRTPALLTVTTADYDQFSNECFGPVSYIVKSSDSAEALSTIRRLGEEKGAITLSGYTTDDAVLEALQDTACSIGVSLSLNLTAGLLVNQSAAFSDFHATGANPAGNASLTDSAFVANRFRVVGIRRHA